MHLSLRPFQGAASPLITATRRLPASAAQCRLAGELRSGRRWRRWHQAPLAAGSPANTGGKQAESAAESGQEGRRSAYNVVQEVGRCDRHLQRRDAAAEGSHRLVGNAGEEVQLLAALGVRPQVPPARRRTRGSRFEAKPLGAGTWSSEGGGGARVHSGVCEHAVTVVSAGPTTSVTKRQVKR